MRCLKLTLLALPFGLAACQSLPEQAPSAAPTPVPQTQPADDRDPQELRGLQLAQRVEKLLQQKYIDPLTRFIEHHAASRDPIIQQYREELRIEQRKRCKRIAAVYAQRAKTAAMLTRLTHGYQYSCPDIVSQFAAQVAPVAAAPEQAVQETAPPPVVIERADSNDYAAEQADLAREPVVPADPDFLAAQHTCQLHYHNKHYLAAAQACEQPATSGDMASQYYLGVVFRALKSYEKALHWLKLAAMQGHAEADLELGQIYRLGQGVVTNRQTARLWYQRAAALHQQQALYYLGLIADNTLDAYAWFNLAAQSGIAEAAVKRDAIDRQFNPQQRQAAQALSLALHRQLQ